MLQQAGEIMPAERRQRFAVRPVVMKAFAPLSRETID